MSNNSATLHKIGFTITPHDISSIDSNPEKIRSWLNSIDFNSAMQFYGLDQHQNFQKLFNKYIAQFKSSPDLQTGAYILNKYLFSPTKYNWTHDLKRQIIDPLPALILLSGYKTHQQNMKSRKFDSYQEDKHRFRISETCTRGLDVYKIKGSEISQLIWGSFFINAHIIEFGRLQYELMRYDYQIPNFTPKHEYCINIHVPRGQKLSNESVSKSLNRAQENIPTYFPECPPNPNMFIDSWLMDKNLEPYLPQKSNIRLFRERFDILHQLAESSLSKFLFNTSSTDISQYPSDTYLREQIKTALQNGKKFHDGIAILKQSHMR